jgi:hypothetical protein
LKNYYCCRCNVELKINENAYKRPTGKPYPYCKKCFNDYCNERWVQRKIDAVKLKGGCCIKCGYNKSYKALDFHHRDSTQKDFDWRKLKLRTWKSIVKELKKCDLLCSNCHRELH